MNWHHVIRMRVIVTSCCREPDHGTQRLFCSPSSLTSWIAFSLLLNVVKLSKSCNNLVAAVVVTIVAVVVLVAAEDAVCSTREGRCAQRTVVRDYICPPPAREGHDEVGDNACLRKRGRARLLVFAAAIAGVAVATDIDIAIPIAFVVCCWLSRDPVSCLDGRCS